MNVSKVVLNGTPTIRGMHDQMQDVITSLRRHIDLSDYSDGVGPVRMNMSIPLRLCLFAGLCDRSPRSIEDVMSLNLPVDSTPYPTTFFSKADVGKLFEALLKLRYHDVDGDWGSPAFIARVIGREILRGRDIVLKEGAMEDWLLFAPKNNGGAIGDIPELNLHIGMYENDMPAYLDMNSRSIANTQILIAGTTGSGKSNLLAVLINQIRELSTETHYPVNFLLFDYKGEFSDPQHELWLQLFNTNHKAILNPIERPLPFTPFKDFTGKPINEVNLYATELSSALGSISRTSISANMDSRLSMAIVNAYKDKKFKPVTFFMRWTICSIV